MISCRAWRTPRPSQRPRATPTLQSFQLGSVLKYFNGKCFWSLTRHWGVTLTEELKLISLKYNATWHYWELGCLLLLCFCISRLVLQKNYYDIAQLIVFTWKSSCTCCKISGLPQYGGSRCEILCCCQSLPFRRLCKCTLWSSDLFRCWSCFRFSPSLSSLLPPAPRDPQKASNLGRSIF